eukprot:349859-Chlamydomonas_euryale.AAC.1
MHGYRILVQDDDGPRIVVSRDVRFKEDVFPLVASPAVGAAAAVQNATAEAAVGATAEEAAAANLDVPPPDGVRRSKRLASSGAAASMRRMATEASMLTQESIESICMFTGEGLPWVEEPLPEMCIEAVASPSTKFWLEAMQEEMKSQSKHGTWKLGEPPPGRVEQYKARLINRGFNQRPGEYGEVFAPSTKSIAIRLMLAWVAEHDLELDSVDVKTAFLQALLQEKLWMDQPPGLEDLLQPHAQCELLKALYGLKQAPRAWYLTFKQELEKMGFQQSPVDRTLYEKQGTRLLVHVDDGLIGGTRVEVDEVKAALRAVFDIKDLGPVSSFFGMRVTRDREARTLKLNQETMITSVLE